MHTFGYDAQTLTLVGLLSGKGGDEDVEDFVRVGLLLDEEGVRQGRLTAHMVVVEDGYPRPSPSARRNMAESLKKFKVHRPLFALVTTSSLIRGVTTIMKWLAPQVHEVESFSTFEAAAEWLEKKRNERLPILAALYAEAKSKAKANRT